MPLMYIGVEGVKEMGYNACSMMIFSMAMFVREMITRNCSIKGQLHRKQGVHKECITHMFGLHYHS